MKAAKEHVTTMQECRYWWGGGGGALGAEAPPPQIFRFSGFTLYRIYNAWQILVIFSKNALKWRHYATKLLKFHHFRLIMCYSILINRVKMFHALLCAYVIKPSHITNCVYAHAMYSWVPLKYKFECMIY